MICVICGTDNEPEAEVCKNCQSPLRLELPMSYQQMLKEEGAERIEEEEAKTEPVIPARKRRRIYILAAILLTVCLGTAVWLWSRHADGEEDASMKNKGTDSEESNKEDAEAIISSQITENNRNEGDWRTRYKRFLTAYPKENAGASDSQDLQYQYIYLDADEVPELLISDGKKLCLCVFD